MLGIDIDKDLIKEARRQWGSVVREEKEKERGEGGKEGGQEVKGNRGEKRERQTDGVVGWNEVGGAGGASSGLGAAPQGSGGMAAAAGRAVEEAAAAAAQAVGAARGAGGRPRVVFRCLNVVEADMPRDSADTVLCLSVTKWVHLNWGDAGLIALFANLFHMLRPVRPSPCLTPLRLTTASQSHSSLSLLHLSPSPCPTRPPLPAVTCPHTLCLTHPFPPSQPCVAFPASVLCLCAEDTKSCTPSDAERLFLALCCLPRSVGVTPRTVQQRVLFV
ncbi:hypothetical protein CLOP_g5114 [Closterium sp. NIES-67]|nr:hypothetical protein CLOP_g5114 [Closterium sp. NIES-67]